MILYLFSEFILATIVGVSTAALFILLIVVVTSVVSSHRTVRVMKEGARIALDAQQVNDEWDTKKAKVFADIFSQGARVSAAHRPANPSLVPTGLPALPLPSQDDDRSWIPALTSTTIDAEPPIEIEEDLPAI